MFKSKLYTSTPPILLVPLYAYQLKIASCNYARIRRILYIDCGLYPSCIMVYVYISLCGLWASEIQNASLIQMYTSRSPTNSTLVYLINWNIVSDLPESWENIRMVVLSCFTEKSSPHQSPWLRLDQADWNLSHWSASKVFWW